MESLKLAAARQPDIADRLSAEARVEAAVIERVLAGDVDEFRKLVDRYQGPLRSTLHRLLGNSTDAEDIAQQAFLEAFHKLVRFDPSWRFSTWLFRIATRRAKDWYKSHKRREGPLQSMIPADRAFLAGAVTDPESELSRAQSEDALYRALVALPYKYREAVVLKDVMELSYEEIGEVLGVSVRALKSRVVRGREAARQLLGDHAAVRWER